jgi:iron complex transport system substrate-binding protein
VSHQGPRVVSLLPALTELVGELGRASLLVGVSHECDVPAEVVARLPRVTRSLIDSSLPSREIDRQVRESTSDLYVLDHALLEELAPELILTQAQCDVCAISERAVRDCAGRLPGNPEVLSIHPTSLAQVVESFHTVGRAIGAERDANELAESFEATLEEVHARVARAHRPRTLLMEWIDPPFVPGHWNVEIIDRAGGLPLLNDDERRPAQRVTWEDIASADPEVILVAACGLDVDRTSAELATIRSNPVWSGLRAVQRGQVHIFDGNTHFSRPGPRLAESVQLAALAIHPEVFDDA